MVKTQQKVIVRPVQQNNCLKMRQKKKEPKVRKAAAIFTYSSVSHSNKKQTLSGHDNICLKRHKNKKCLKRQKQHYFLRPRVVGPHVQIETHQQKGIFIK